MTTDPSTPMTGASAPVRTSGERHGLQTYIYYVAEKIPGAKEMQRFAHPIHVGIVTAENHMEAYETVLEDLRPTFADAPQPLEIRFEAMIPPRSGMGIWRHSKPIDTDVTFSDDD